jgi:nitric oxide reductase NorD protein
VATVGLGEEFLDALQPSLTTPSDELARFGLVASAIAGRVVDVTAAEPGEATWTDGATVFVDASLTPGVQLQAVAVQASLLGAGSLGDSVLGGLRRSGTAGRYLAVEGHRALVDHEAVLPSAARALIDRPTAGRSDSPAASLGLATSRAVVPAAPDIFGTIRPRRVRSAAGTPVGDATVSQHIPTRRRDEALRELDDGEDDEGPVIDILSSPVGGSGGIGRLLKRMFGDARSSGTGPPGSTSPTHRSRRGTRRARTVALTTVTAAIPERAEVAAQEGTTYPEWDVHRRRYRPDWCTVVEAEPGPEELYPLLVPDTRALRRPLARLGMELERRRRQLQGDEIDIDAVVAGRVDARAGKAADEALYIDTLRRRRDLAVLILMDISGSSGEPSAAGATVHEHQRSATASLMVALHEHGDRVAAYGFRSQGRTAVRLVPVKRFGEPLGALAMHRLGGLVPGGYTRMGAAIRHGAALLEHGGGTTRRLLLVVSDGFAYDHGYEGAYGEADARRALAESRRRGTGCLCLSIGAGTDVDALRRVFGSTAHAAIPRPELLSGVIGPLFRAALKSAEAQRRVTVRRERARERLDIERRPA